MHKILFYTLQIQNVYSAYLKNKQHTFNKCIQVMWLLDLKVNFCINLKLPLKKIQ